MDRRLAFFNERAKTWGESWDLSAMRDRLRRELDSFDLPWQSDLLDLGCGRGILLAKLLERADVTALLHAVDYAPAMIAEIRKQFSDPRIRLHHCDAAAIPLPEGSLDAVLCFSSFPHFTDPEAVLQEIHRLLSPGGRFFIWHHDSSERLNAMHRKTHPAVSDDHLEPVLSLSKRAVKCGFYADDAFESDDTYRLILSKP